MFGYNHDSVSYIWSLICLSSLWFRLLHFMVHGASFIFRFIFVCFIFSFRLFYLGSRFVIFSAVSFFRLGSFSSVLSSHFVFFISFSAVSFFRLYHFYLLVRFRLFYLLVSSLLFHFLFNIFNIQCI